MSLQNPEILAHLIFQYAQTMAIENALKLAESKAANEKIRAANDKAFKSKYSLTGN